MLKEKNLIVEVGFGDKPFPIVGQRKIKHGEVYVGVNLVGNRDLFTPAIRSVCDLDSKDRFYFIKGTATDLPFPNNSAKLVVLCNVFCVPDGVYLARSIIPEVKRVVRDNGKVAVVETYTPDQAPLPELESLFQWHGLKVISGGIDPIRLFRRYAENPYLNLASSEAVLAFFRMSHFAAEFKLEMIDPRKQPLIDEFFSNFS